MFFLFISIEALKTLLLIFLSGLFIPPPPTSRCCSLNHIFTAQSGHLFLYGVNQDVLIISLICWYVALYLLLIKSYWALYLSLRWPSYSPHWFSLAINESSNKILPFVYVGLFHFSSLGLCSSSAYHCRSHPSIVCKADIWDFFRLCSPGKFSWY